MKLPAGTTLPGEGYPFVAFDVDESHANWVALSHLFRTWRVSDVVRTVFTQKEIAAAHWSEITAWHHGYPEPDRDEFGYLRATYDLSKYCEQCGMGAKQNAPFQMRGEPKWGRNGVMQLVWVYGELFVRPEVWERIFKPAGVPSRSVLNRKGAELKTVVQLVVEATVPIVTESLPAERCSACGRAKYLPVARGPFPALRELPTVSMARTADYFGSGAQADQAMLISQELTRALTASAIRGPSFRPVSETTRRTTAT